MRGNDTTIKCELKKVFDNDMPKINVIPQDLSRVLINLFNNAFYAVNEKFNNRAENYKPMVSLSTKLSGKHIYISVKDNGTGIPDKVKEKIFQPFFTTKPTGKGTGLGLSLSYDIIHAHGGKINVESKEGEGTEFIVDLPI